MTSRPATTLLATGFVADEPHEGTTYPSAGGNSADPRVQAVYWRSIVALFASARYTNPHQRLAVFSNVAPPVVDGVAVAEVLARYRVEVYRLPLATRLPPGTTRSWGNVLYFHDIMTALARTEDPELRVAVVDADMLVTRALAPLFALLDDRAFAGYVVRQTDPADSVNGLSMHRMTELSRELGATGEDRALHYGGELFLSSLAAWTEHRALFAAMVRNAMAGGGITTEEHVFSIAFAVLRGRVASANHLIKRIWTSPRYSSVAPGDERLLLWHLPAEKRYGLRDMFKYLRRADFPQIMDAAAFRDVAMRRCGVPRKRWGKVLHDGVRQTMAKLGLYR